MWYAIIFSLVLAWWYHTDVALELYHTSWHLPIAAFVILFWALYAAVDVLLHLKEMAQEITEACMRPWQRLYKHHLEKKNHALYLKLATTPETVSLEELKEAMRTGAQPPALLCAMIVRPKTSYLELIQQSAHAWLGDRGLVWLAHAYAHRPDTRQYALLLLRDHLFQGRMPHDYHSALPTFDAEIFSLCPIPPKSPHRSWDPWLIRVCAAHLILGTGLEDTASDVLRHALKRHRLLQWASLEGQYQHACVPSDPPRNDLEWAYDYAYQPVLDPKLHDHFLNLGIARPDCAGGLHQCAHQGHQNCASRALTQALYQALNTA